MCQHGTVGIRLTRDPDLVAQLDVLVGPPHRSRFIAEAVRRALDNDHRWELIESAIGAVPDGGHDWDDDPGAWVHQQRHGAPRTGQDL